MFSQGWLSQEFLRNKLLQSEDKKSLRQWAQIFEMSPSALSEILNQKRPLSLKSAQLIAQKAKGWTAKERKEFLSPFEKVQLIKKSRVKQIRPVVQKNIFKKLNAETFSLISDWEHFAILNLLNVNDFQPNTQWVAQRLGIGVGKVEVACDRLECLNLLVRSPKKWSRGTTALSTLDDVPQEAVKNAHKSYLKHIETALDYVSPADREISGIVMAINSELVGVAKEIIRDFQNKMMDLLEQKGKQDALFYLGVQLVPLGLTEKNLRNEL